MNKSTADMRGRRTEDRATTVFRPALIETEEFSGFCLVRNLSSNGMMARVYAHLTEGTRIGVQFSPDIKINGSVIWCIANDVGVRFDEPIDVHNVLSSLSGARQDGKLNRAPRLQMQVGGHVVLENQQLVIALEDISQKGAKVRGSLMRPGDEVLLCLDGLEPKKSVVRWARLGAAGLNFVQPLSFDQLGHWVIAQQLKQLPVEPAGYRNQPHHRCIP